MILSAACGYCKTKEKIRIRKARRARRAAKVKPTRVAPKKALPFGGRYGMFN